jgi:glycosyltransferase involved in cell wall biosynthesis
MATRPHGRVRLSNTILVARDLPSSSHADIRRADQKSFALSRDETMPHSHFECADWSCLVPDPVVSVVMPTYNHQCYLGEAIQGVLNQQTVFPFELIIGDDCSSDGTREIALRYQRQRPDIVRVLTSESRMGMHENDRRIFSAVRGRYMAFCEGDDYWHRTDKLSRQIEILESDARASLVCSSWRVVSDLGDLLDPDALRLDRTRSHCLDLHDILCGHVKTVTVCARTAVIQKALRESPLCKTGRYPFGDAPLWVEASRTGDCICLPHDYGSYRLSRESVTRPRDIMDVYRFVAAASEFDRDVLGLYPLPQGDTLAATVRIQATRKRLRALAFLGEASKVHEEMRWLRRLGAKIRLRDYSLFVGSILSQPGTIGARSRQWALHAWHSYPHSRIPITRPAATAEQTAALAKETP